MSRSSETPRVVSAQKKRQLDPNLITSGQIPQIAEELFVSLFTKVMLMLHGKPRDIVVTGLDMDAGKSTIAANLAIASAQSGSKTVLIDGDIRRGVLHNAFVRTKSPGLSEWLSESTPPHGDDIGSIVQETHVPNLSLISSGTNAPNPTTLLSSPRVALLKTRLDQAFGTRILDTPPLGAGTDAVLVHETFTNYVIVVRAGKTNIMDLNRKIAEFGPLRDKILGIVLNRGRLDRRRQYYYYPRA